MIRVGISSCLLGSRVRFNGQHKKDSYVVDVLDKYFKWIPICPEVDIGMGIPREPVRLVGELENPEMIGVKSEKTWTQKMVGYSRKKANQLKQMKLHGYILKSKSPSCGMERVKVYLDSAMPVNKGTGLFARQLMQTIPNLPIEEEGRLNDPELRENFIVRVFCYHRWSQLKLKPFKLEHLVQFHSHHKFLLMAHNETKMRQLGRFVANARNICSEEALHSYENLFFSALKRKASRKRHTNVLQHIAGYFKNTLDAIDRKELQATIEDYHKGLLPLIVPITLIRHHLHRSGQSYIASQIYLNPHPKELMLLNHV